MFGRDEVFGSCADVQGRSVPAPIFCCFADMVLGGSQGFLFKVSGMVERGCEIETLHTSYIVLLYYKRTMGLLF